jgi:NAD(P) transhydrogenase subunit alpha
MRLAVLKERDPQETRVAAVPDSVKKLIGLGLEVAIESAAGERAGHVDQAYRDAGATVEADAAAALKGAGIVFAVQAPDEEITRLIPEGALLVATVGALTRPELVERFAQAKIDACAMELLPRITRAQTMDVLSSQANLAGYRAVIEAAEAFPRSFPMMMTAAGTVAPARIFIVGAGVAGLQAIATARRLGAIVSATDVRPAAKEEIRSLGASFIGVEDEESKQQTGAYAKEMSDEFRRKQAELVAETVGKSDIVLCTALVLGRKAPVIVSEDAVKRMKPGSVIVDIAADSGGNCAMTQPGERIVTDNGVTILGYRNWPSRIGIAASGLYARNLFTFLSTFWDKDAGRPKLPDEDDIVKGVLLTRGGSVVHPNFKPKEAA